MQTENELRPDTTISHYRIVSKIGAGGMGEVYLAQDTKLDRKVALKILPPDVAEDRSRMNRFVQEAKAASALNHPNIITIYEIDETDLGHFIATEFIDGETVRECLRKAPLTVSEALNIAAQIAAALAAAHRAGIIHRDIKPENVMIRADGLVKVLDFGLAKLTDAGASDPESATRISDTQPGMIMGTVAYMSPEQARGKPLDQRTDVWSLGVVLYEMLSRRSPFSGETVSDTLANILHREPETLNIGALPDLSRIVQTMLAKKLEARYQTMADAVSDLKKLQRRVEFDSELQETALRSSAEAHTLVIASATASKSVNETAADSASSRAEEGFWVAVLPFKYRGSNPDLEALAEGLSEDIIAGLSRFSVLRVIARGSTLRFLNESSDLRSIGKQLGARYVMEGSLRQVGSMLRLVVQLVDAATGAHLWAETFDRRFDNENAFALHDDLVPRIVSTVADWYGVLTHSMSEAVRLKPSDQLTPYEAVLRSFGYYERVTAEEHAASRSALERAVEQSPGNADGWAMLSMMYGEEYRFGFNELPDSMERSLQSARRAVNAAPSNHFAYLALAQALFFRKEFDRFRHAAERAIALNPMDGSTMEYVSHLIAFSGDWDYGCEVAERARQLNPNHPGWYWAVPFYNAYRNGDYPTARAFALKIDQPTVDLCQVMLAAVYGQLGEHEAAHRTVQTLLSLTPDTAVTRKQLDKWYQPELVEKLIDGLRKAGLNISEETALRSSTEDNTLVITSATASKAVNEMAADSASTRLDEGFWVAVLPFKYPGSNPDLEALGDGLSEDIVTGLSRFPHLRVIARSSTSRFTGASGDVRSIGKELGARYVVEGSLRHAGAMLRVTVQLLDAITGAHMWAETYNRDLNQSDLFTVQDDITDRVVATVADSYGVLVRSMAASIEEKPETELTASDWILRQYRYRQLLTPEEHTRIRDGLERFVEREPKHAAPWACLAQLYIDEFVFKFNPRPDALDRALAAARRSVDLDRTFQYGHQILAQVHFFRRDTAAFRTTAEQAMLLNSRDTDTIAMMGLMLVHIAEFERGANIVRRAMDLNPNHAGWYHFAIIWEHLNKSDYEKALARITRVNMPGLFWQPLTIASICGLLGRSAEASAAVQELRKLDPDFEQHVREYIEVWHYSSGLMDRILEGLRKAGVEIAQDAPRISSPVTARAAVAESAPSIAVLPFSNLSNDPNNDYFCDGLAEELLNALAKIDELKVAARTSAFSFKERNVEVSEIASALNVNTILEGSVRMSANRIRITTQLINAADGYHLWSERYDREMKDVFDIQDEITVAVVEALKVRLLREEKDAVLKRHTMSPEAHEFYLRGLFYFNRFTPDDFQKASENFRRAIAIDPRYALAYAGLADAYTELSFFSFSPSEAMPKAREAANKALELDDRLGEAHNSLAIIKMYFDWDYAGAEQEFKRAIALNPGSAPIHMWYGWYLGLMGRFDESFKEMQGAQELDPLSATNNSGIGIVLHWSRQPERAIEQFRKVLELNPNYPLACGFLAEAYEQKGDFVSAIATIEKIQQAATDPLTLSTMGYVYAKSGDRQRALEILNEFVKRSNQEYVPALNFAQIYAGLGDNEQALAWLDKACNERAVWIPFLKVDLKFDPLRSDVRFQELLKKAGFLPV